MIGGDSGRSFVFVATLGFSRRCFVQAFTGGKQSRWLAGIEGAVQNFGGLSRHLLIDNPKSIVHTHNIQSGDLPLNPRFDPNPFFWSSR
jgi:transposase